MIRFACPSCSAVYSVSDDKGGRTTTCKKCNNPFQIPDAAPPPVAQAIPMPEDVVVVEDAPRRKRRRDEEEDRPSRRQRDEYDDDYDRPRPKKPRYNPLVLSIGIVFVGCALLVGTIGIIDAVNFKNHASQAYDLGKAWGVEKSNMPKEAKSYLDQLYAGYIFLQIFFYLSIVAALVWLASGIVLILQQRMGRTLAFFALAASILCAILYLVGVILLNNAEAPKAGGGRAYDPGEATHNLFVRFAMHLLPVIVGFSTLFMRPMIKLKNSF